MDNKRPNPLSSLAYVLFLVLALAVFAVGLVLTIRNTGVASLTVGAVLLGAGCVSFIGALAAWPIATILESIRTPTLKHQEELLATLTDRLQQISVMINMISEQQLLSDRAKFVAFRENDRDALRRAIREEMGKRDWEAALVLAGDIERVFGYKQEADTFRKEINDQRQEIVRKQIGESVAVIDRHCRAELWPDAIREADRLRGMFPDDSAVQQLPQEIENRRQGHKKQLVDSWHDAVNRHDVDGSIEILKKLDPYLTPSEAESMQETARGVFKEKLNNLKTQFSIAVQDHKWNEAVRIGDQIMREFPNSRIAQEVKETMDVLRQRATGGTPEVAKV